MIKIKPFKVETIWLNDQQNYLNEFVKLQTIQKTKNSATDSNNLLLLSGDTKWPRAPRWRWWFKIVFKKLFREYS